MLKAKRAKPALDIIRDPLRCFLVESVQVVVGIMEMCKARLRRAGS